jgi:hypothetical protein
MSLRDLVFDMLLVGHSLVGFDLPVMVQQLVQSQGAQMQVQAHVINGAPLIYNWNESRDAQGVDARAVLPQGRHGVVVITESLPLATQMEWNDTVGYARRFHDLAVTSRPGTQVFLYETWHSLNSGTGRPTPYDNGGDVPWRQRLMDDLPRWQSIVDGVNAARAPGQPEMRLLPAGQAMGRLADEIAAGRVPGLRDIRELFQDDIHPNDLGFYFLALVHVAAITGMDPVGLPTQLRNEWGTPFDAPPEVMARALQRIAAEFRGPGLDGATLASAPATAPPADTVPVAAPVAAVAPVSMTPRAGRLDLALNLSAISSWSSSQPFLDIMRTAQEWSNHDQLAAAGILDEHGWIAQPLSRVGAAVTQILLDVPEGAVSLAGRYVARWEGDAIVGFGGRAQGARYGNQTASFNYTPGHGSVMIEIRRGTLRNLTIVHERHLERFDAGEIFNPDWLALVQDAAQLRFMDWANTNNSTITQWDERPRIGDYTWTRGGGVPLEIMLRLANETGAEPWLTVPHLADDAYMRAYAETVRQDLRPDLRAWIEFSNEVWNWSFLQADWAETAAQARWGQDWAWVQLYAVRAAEVMNIFSQVFAGEQDRLVRVMGMFTGWLGLEHDMLNAPLYVAEAPGQNHPPFQSFDAYAVTAYFSGQLHEDHKQPVVANWLRESRGLAERAADAAGLTGQARSAYIQTHRFDHAVALAARELRDGSVTGQGDDSLRNLLDVTLAHHAGVAREYGLALVMYEGGSHVVTPYSAHDDVEMIDFLEALNYSPEFGELTRDLVTGWRQIADGPFNQFTEVERHSIWGSWGARRHLDDDNPRWRALIEAAQ